MEIKCECPKWDQEQHPEFKGICVGCGKPIERRDNMIEYAMPHWSKYHGEDISDVPRSYLEFLLERSWIDQHPELIEAIEDQFAIRDRSHLTF